MKLILCSFVLLSSLVLCKSSNCNSPASLFSGPESRNATNGSRVLFRCRGIAENIFWFIDDEKVDQNNMVDLQVNGINQSKDSNCNVNSTLSVTAGTNSNNSRIYCSATKGPLQSTNSDDALLRVQGPPIGLHGLQVTHHEEDWHHVAWSPPPSLHGIQTLYNVSVIDVFNGSQIFSDNASSRTSFDLRLTPCHGYSFTVIPYNGAGTGEPVMVQYTYPGAPIPPMVENIGVTSLALNTNSGLVIATVQYTATSVCYNNQNITVETRVLDDQPFLASPSQVIDNVVTVLIDNIPLNKVLSVDLVLSNRYGTAPIDGGLMIKTYNTQSVVITTNHSTTCFKCVFLTNSMSSGCLLALNPVTSSDQETCSTKPVPVNITLPQTNCSSTEKCFNGFINGSYNIDVYDIFNNSNDTIRTDTAGPPQVLRNIDIEGRAVSCPNKTGNTDVSRIVATPSTDVRNTLSTDRTPGLTPGSIENNNNTMRIAGLLIGVVCGILIITIIIIIIIIGIFIYRKQRIKEGSLAITQNTTDTKETSGVNNIPPDISDDQDQGPSVAMTTSHAVSSLSFSSLGPPPYQPPPSITSNFDHYPTEQYIIMHSASPRSPTASNSTSSHLALIQGCGSSSNSSSHRDLSTNGHYDHLVQVDREDVTKKHWADNLQRTTTLKSTGHYHQANSNGDHYSFEMKPYTRNEHLV